MDSGHGSQRQIRSHAFAWLQANGACFGRVVLAREVGDRIHDIKTRVLLADGLQAARDDGTGGSIDAFLHRRGCVVLRIPRLSRNPEVIAAGLKPRETIVALVIRSASSLHAYGAFPVLNAFA